MSGINQVVWAGAPGVGVASLVRALRGLPVLGMHSLTAAGHLDNSRTTLVATPPFT